MWRLPRPRVGKTILSACVLITCAVPLLVFAHDDKPQLVATSRNESSFLRENETAMTKMMEGMAAKPSGDIDRDFVAMMSPHHQGAIDMAVIELRYGRNEQLRRIAQEIVVDQMQEIAAMKLAIGEPATDATPAPTQPTPPASIQPDNHDHMDMPMHMSHPMK
jgi:Domain of unknown function (DUF305)